MRICEMFASIQGESTLQGFPTFFIRAAGCNLACRYCDTPYAAVDGEEISPGDILDHARRSGLSHICITGGEPLLQMETITLMEKFLSAGKTVSIETNGSLSASHVPEGCRRIIDIKCPSSTAAGSIDWSNLENTRPTDEFKCVIQDEHDYEYARTVCRNYALTERAQVLISCVSGALDPARAAEWLLRDRFPARLHLQLHKIIWPGARKGR